MFRAAPPGPDPGRPLRVSAVARQAFPGSSRAAPDPALVTYLTDMIAPYGVDLRADWRGEGHSYGEMGGEIVAALVGGGPVRAMSTVIVASLVLALLAHALLVARRPARPA